MKIEQIKSRDLDWTLNFSPLKPWPGVLPVIATPSQGAIKVVAGFDRKEHPVLDVLLLEGHPRDALLALHNDLAPFEQLRFNLGVGLPTSYAFLKDCSMEFQNFCDERAIPLKALKPIQYLGEWVGAVTSLLINLKLTGSQVREALDLLCDLKFQGSTLENIQPQPEEKDWIQTLRKKRNPITSSNDENTNQRVQKMSWPKGVQAKWERHGDQAGVQIQTKIASLRDWQKFKESLSDLNLEGIWKI